MKPGERIKIMDSDVADEALPLCQFCALWHTESSEAGSRQAMNFMTEREVHVLEDMRRIKKEASRLKRRMRQMEADLGGDSSIERTYHEKRYYEIRGKLWVQGMQEDWMQLSERLHQLRVQWRDLDLDRMEATDERMHLLGHLHD